MIGPELSRWANHFSPLSACPARICDSVFWENNRHLPLCARTRREIVTSLVCPRRARRAVERRAHQDQIS
jgi:hypothetical protein